MSVALKNFGTFTFNRPDRAVQGEIQHRLEPRDRLRHALSCVEAAAAFVGGRTRAANANADVRRAKISELFTAIRPARAVQGGFQYRLKP